MSVVRSVGAAVDGSGVRGRAWAGAALALAVGASTLAHGREASAQMYVQPVPIAFQPAGEGDQYTVTAGTFGMAPMSCQAPCTMPLAAGAPGFVQVIGTANFRVPFVVPPMPATYRVRRRNVGLVIGGATLALIGTLVFGIGEIGAIAVDYEPPLGLPLAIVGLVGAVLSIPGYVMMGAAGRDRIERIAAVTGPRFAGIGVAPGTHGGATSSLAFTF